MRNDLRRILMMVLLLGLLPMAHGGAGGGGAPQADPPLSNPGCAASQGDCSGE